MDGWISGYVDGQMVESEHPWLKGRVGKMRVWVKEPSSLPRAWVGVCWQALQQELALCWSSMEKLDQRAQILAGPGAPEHLRVVRERLWEQLRALREQAATR